MELFIPPLSLCTDNAAMAGIALVKLAAGEVSALDSDVTAGLVRPGRGEAKSGLKSSGLQPHHAFES